MSSPLSQPTPFYPYTPSLPAAVVAVSVYSALTALHGFRMIQTRTWDNIPFVLGGITQAAGYGARIASSQDVFNRTAYGAQAVMLMLGPSMFMFTVNLTQAPFMRVLKAQSLGFTPFRWQRTIYTSWNLIAFSIQAIGVGLMVAAADDHAAAVAIQIITASFVIQMVLWVFIMVEGIMVQFRLARRPQTTAFEVMPRWKRWHQLFGLAAMIIFGRNLMRLTQFGLLSEDIFFTRKEWPNYAFDGYQMVVVMAAWGVFYLPGKCKEAEVAASRNWLEMEAESEGGNNLHNKIDIDTEQNRKDQNVVYTIRENNGGSSSSAGAA